MGHGVCFNDFPAGIDKTIFKGEENMKRLDEHPSSSVPHREQPSGDQPADRRVEIERATLLSSYNPLWCNYIQSRLKQFVVR